MTTASPRPSAPASTAATDVTPIQATEPLTQADTHADHADRDAAAVTVMTQPPARQPRGGGPGQRLPDPWADYLADQRIDRADRLRPFLMSVVSASDHWMYVSSRGGLTAGRCEAERCLFPYETDDRLHQSAGRYGPFTLIRIDAPGSADARPTIWRPFQGDPAIDDVPYHLTKSVLGHRVGFATRQETLGLGFSYTWQAAGPLGWARRCELTNDSDRPLRLSIVDGLLGIMPAGVPLGLQQASSCLVNAYRRCEATDAGLGVFYMESAITDKAEACESLRSSTLWQHGLGGATVLLTRDQCGAFARGGTPSAERELKGREGSYLVHAEIELPPGAARVWWIVGDVYRSQADVAGLEAMLADPATLVPRIEAACRENAEALIALLGRADGLQRSGRDADWVHHLANVTFNSMRGGVPVDGYRAPLSDVVAHVRRRRRDADPSRLGLAIDEQADATLDVVSWSAELEAHHADTADTVTDTDNTPDADAIRWAMEYLPITFGRRHGDPSRPWNRFEINLTHADGSPRLDYAGNWRDIFQNWEAMALSYPGLLDRMVARFVNASTVDGFNPYRLTRDGFDWEAPEPDNPWANIGYWGDHQIVYLLKLLEWLHAFDPQRLRAMLTRRVFAFADVPYRLKRYNDIVANPRDSIDYDHAAAARTAQRVAAIGQDGQLRPAADGGVEHVTLVEKLLVPVLSKLSAYVPDGGVWMNTQRPEWNDANNALAGYGLSVVTACYLRRHLAFLAQRFEEAGEATVSLNAPLAAWLDDTMAAFEALGAASAKKSGVDTPARAIARRWFMDAVGTAFERYRQAAFAGPLAKGADVRIAELADNLRAVLPELDRCIAANRRDDGLFHGYNVLELANADHATGGDPIARIKRLDLMLEGQVAALSSGAVTPDEAVRVIDRLYDSALYRPDQHSFMLYPNRAKPGYLARNRVDAEAAAGIGLLRDMLTAGDRSIVERGADGVVRFHSDLVNAAALEARLDKAATDPRWADAATRDRRAVLDLYEAVFHHHAFTGRSGGMYAYEGLGSIYWHMVSKLLLAMRDVIDTARRDDTDTDPAVIAALVERYERVRSGLSAAKTAEQYGAFPTDPYSHSPAHAGAQQPGMTGQVKEEIIARWAELGVWVTDGELRFDPVMVRPEAFVSEPTPWHIADEQGRPRRIDLPPGAAGFTLFGLPVVLRRDGEAPGIHITERNEVGQPVERTFDHLTLPADVVSDLTRRAASIDRITVNLAMSSD